MKLYALRSPHGKLIYPTVSEEGADGWSSEAYAWCSGPAAPKRLRDSMRWKEWSASRDAAAALGYRIVEVKLVEAKAARAARRKP